MTNTYSDVDEGTQKMRHRRRQMSLTNMIKTSTDIQYTVVLCFQEGHIIMKWKISKMKSMKTAKAYYMYNVS
jgi:hypothetical protein